MTRQPPKPRSLIEAEAALKPCDKTWLDNRLSLLWDHMSHDRDGNRATAWLHETARLLSDLPQDILATAIDEAIKRKTNGFMPSVGEIRAEAEQALAWRRSTLRSEQRLHEQRIAAEKERATIRCTPEQAAEIMRRGSFAPATAEGG